MAKGKKETPKVIRYDHNAIAAWSTVSLYVELETGVKLQLPQVLKIQGLVREAGLQGFLWKALRNADIETEH